MKKKLQVLYIENDVEYVTTYNELLSGMLSFEFNDPEVVYDKQTALNKIEQWRMDIQEIPDVIFLDLILPEHGASCRKDDMHSTDAGIDIYQKIRGIEEFGIESYNDHPAKLTNLPIVVLTTNYRVPPDKRAKMCKDNCLYLIDKPFIPDDVANVVNNFICKALRIETN